MPDPASFMPSAMPVNSSSWACRVGVGSPFNVLCEILRDVEKPNAPACIAEIEATFLTRSLADWRTRLEGFTGVWAAALTPAEVHEHVQVEANGYLPELTSQEGARFRLPAPPMQFGGEAPAPRGPAPELGQHTEEILL